jgi:hypothetical protein
VTLARAVIAGTVGMWYSQEDKNRSISISTALFYALGNHPGSIFLGAFATLMTTGYRGIFGRLSKIARGKGSTSLWIVLMPLVWVAVYVDRLVGQAGDNALVQLMLTGLSYMESGRNAYKLITRNSGRVTALAGTSDWVNMFGRIFVTTLATGGGWLMYCIWFTGTWVSPIAPILGFIVSSYYVGGIILSLLYAVVPAIIQCYLVDAEVNADEGGAKNAPSRLSAFLQKVGVNRE